MFQEYCIEGRMRHLIFSLCFIFCIYAQDSHALQWQSMDCKESDNLLITALAILLAIVSSLVLISVWIITENIGGFK